MEERGEERKEKKRESEREIDKIGEKELDGKGLLPWKVGGESEERRKKKKRMIMKVCSRRWDEREKIKEEI